MFFVVPLVAVLAAVSASSVLHVVEHAINEEVFFHGDVTATPTLGDKLVFANPIFDGDDEKEVGRSSGVCYFLSGSGADFAECTWTNYFDSGSITVQGEFSLDPAVDTKLAITGGTGRFQNKPGFMQLHDRGTDPISYDFVFVFEDDFSSSSSTSSTTSTSSSSSSSSSSD
jgi:allene oxide cyclase